MNMRFVLFLVFVSEEGKLSTFAEFFRMFVVHFYVQQGFLSYYISIAKDI
jgi:hypothetical protein